MNKKIEDYLPYYLGCECFVKASEYYESGKGKLVRIDIEDDQTAVVSSNTLYDRTRYCVEADISDIKPILRPLSSMTEEEAIVVAKMATHLSESEDWKLIEVKREGEMVKVYFTDTWAFNPTKDYFVKVAPYPLQGAFESYKGEILMQHHYQFPLDAYMYLISHHFDLFGLIESNLAIDKTKQP